MAAETELGMTQTHRQHIVKNIDRLIRCTDYRPLVAETVKHGLITAVMRANIEHHNSARHNMTEDEDQLNCHRRFFHKITHRGPTAYNELRAIFRTLRYEEAMLILDEVNDASNRNTFISLGGQNSINSLNSFSNPTSPVNGYSSSNNNNINNNNNNSSSSNYSMQAGCKSPDIVDRPANGHWGDQALSRSASATQYMDPDGELVPYTAPAAKQERVVHKSDRVHTDNVNGVYSMQSKHDRGVLLIVNIIDFPNSKLYRNGAEVDDDSLIHIFREIGFKIFTYKNLNSKEFFSVLSKLTASQHVKNTECFVMVLMSHGERVGEMDHVQFNDGSFTSVKNIINHFQAKKCPNLINKPKVLIFPFCRGDAPDKGHSRIDKLVEPQPERVQKDGAKYDNVPTLSDLLVCYATTIGFETHRDPEDGSWYIQKFCDVMAELAHNTALEDILKRTNMLTGKIRTEMGDLQTGAFENVGFNKKLFLNPGWHSE
ncbi:hypothetical protein KR222_007392 [Zaprionus bogoriensis]|nr:hypothetical protein KR222_007392 [Zaprionus bogoriensis]